MKVAIYSAIFGDYDDLKDQPEQSVETDFLFYSNKEYKSKTWKMMGNPHHVEYSGYQASRLEAKWYKIFPSEEYDLTIWTDGSAQITSKFFTQWIIDNMGNGMLMAFKHPHLDCIYKEAANCFDFPKYTKEALFEQVGHYHKQGYPRNNGLWACGLIARRLGAGYFNSAWWGEINRWSIQDQLSFPYVVWRDKFPITTLDVNQYDNPYIKFLMSEHKSDL